jgi:aerobic carbon-monoxide dehydrogenase medium subunit
MYPAQFDYHTPGTIREALDLLGRHKDDAKLLAGGHSLLPAMKFRLSQPKHLVDLKKVPGLSGIKEEGGVLVIGAMTTHYAIESSSVVKSKCPVLASTAAIIGDPMVRNMGTIGGSLAHADPAAELPGIAVTCDGEITVVGAGGKRTIPAAEFFAGPLTTVLHPDEIVTELCLSPWPARRRWAFEEFSRRQGDFALAGVALFYDEDAQGCASNAHLGVIGACSRPHRLSTVEALINGRVIDDEMIAAAARGAACAIDPPQDLHAPVEYRRALVATLVERALRVAAQSARP